MRSIIGRIKRFIWGVPADERENLAVLTELRKAEFHDISLEEARERHYKQYEAPWREPVRNAWTVMRENKEFITAMLVFLSSLLNVALRFM